MKIITDLSGYTSEGSTVAIGKFDGLHVGHMKLIEGLFFENSESGIARAEKTVFSFNPSPTEFFKGEELQILSRKEKNALLEKAGVENLVEIPFDEKFASLEPERFVSDILKDRLNIKLLIVGKDYRFGRDRKGDIKLLKKLGDSLGFSLTVIPEVSVEGEVVHSSQIRKHILAHNFEMAEKMLGRPYHIDGRIEHGKMLGRKLGFPTVNITVPREKLTPCNGVYITVCEYKGKKMKAVSNIGNNPTVEENQPIKKCETNIFDFSEDIYGEKISIKFYSFIRHEKRFESIDELKNQIAVDVQTAHKFWTNR